MSVGYRIGKAPRTSVLIGLRGPQVFIAIFGLIGCLLIMVNISFFYALIWLVIFAALATLPVYGRTFDEWLPVLIGFYSRGFAKHGLAVSPVPFAGHKSDKSVKIGPPPALTGISVVEVEVVGNRHVGVIKDKKLGTYSLVIKVSGSAFTLIDDEEQDQKLAEWGNFLASLARENSPIHRIQWLERALPEDSEALQRYYEEAVQVEEGSELREAYEDLLTYAAPVSTSHEIYLILTISKNKVGRAIKELGGGSAGAVEVLMKEFHGMEQLMSGAGITVEKLLSPSEVRMLIKSTFDPSLIKRNANSFERNELIAQLWPTAIENNWKYLRTDNVFHSTYWVAEWPRTLVSAGFLIPLLLQTRSPRTVSVVMEPLPPSKTIRSIEAKRTSFLADETIRRRAGFTDTARRTREHDELVDQEIELADGHGPYRFSAYITCSGKDLEELESLMSEVEQSAHQSRLILRRLYGEQDNSFSTALPIGRGLR